MRDRETESDGTRERERLQVRVKTSVLGHDGTRGQVDGRQDSLECV